MTSPSDLEAELQKSDAMQKAGFGAVIGGLLLATALFTGLALGVAAIGQSEFGLTRSEAVVAFASTQLTLVLTFFGMGFLAAIESLAYRIRILVRATSPAQ